MLQVTRGMLVPTALGAACTTTAPCATVRSAAVGTLGGRREDALLLRVGRLRRPQHVPAQDSKEAKHEPVLPVRPPPMPGLLGVFLAYARETPLPPSHPIAFPLQQARKHAVLQTLPLLPPPLHFSHLQLEHRRRL